MTDISYLKQLLNCCCLEQVEGKGLKGPSQSTSPTKAFTPSLFFHHSRPAPSILYILINTGMVWLSFLLVHGPNCDLHPWVHMYTHIQGTKTLWRRAPAVHKPNHNLSIHLFSLHIYAFPSGFSQHNLEPQAGP